MRQSSLSQDDEMSNFISPASDRKRKKNKIKQLYNTTQRGKKHRQMQSSFGRKAKVKLEKNHL